MRKFLDFCVVFSLKFNIYYYFVRVIRVDAVQDGAWTRIILDGIVIESSI